MLHCFQKKTKRTAKSDKAFKSVWDAIEDDPAQAANMLESMSPVSQVCLLTLSKLAIQHAGCCQQTNMATMKGSDWTSASNFLLRKQERHCGLTIVPEGNALDALRGDYQRMLEDGLLLEDTESFDLLMVKCKKIQEQVKRLSAIEDKT